MKDNHTPGPWITYSGSYIKGPKGNTVADCRYKNGIADAEFIVRACNRYPKNRAESDLLGECLEAMQEFIDRVERGEVRSKYTYNKYKAILAKTKEERDEKQKDEQRN